MPKSKYGRCRVEFAPDGEHYQKIKQGSCDKMWNYFNFDSDINEQIYLNKFAKFRLIGESGKIIGVKPRGK